MSRQSPVLFNKTMANLSSTLTPIGPSMRMVDNPLTSRTTRYRHSISRPNPEQLQLSSSLAKDYKPMLKPALPEIKRERGIVLQEWLNDALEGQNGDEGLRRQPLYTLRGYELDKATLRNQNMSLQQINKLYNGLFVYTSGLKAAFQDLFSAASIQQRDDHKLEKMYWKVFIKLLENASPVKTCFQITEQNYIRQIADLKKKINDNAGAFEIQRAQLEDVSRKLRKEVEEAAYRFKEWQSDYKVMKATLDLTEETFNEQVALRLKFEEKINQVYSSYDELQDKYEKMRQDLGNKNESLQETIDQRKELMAQLEQEAIKTNDMFERLQRAEANLKDREDQLGVKRQQILDIELEGSLVDEKKVKQEAALEELLIKIKLLKKYQTENLRKIDQLKAIITTHQSTIVKLKSTLSDVRQKNDQLYFKFHEATLAIVPVQQTNLKQSLEITEVKNQIAAATVARQALQATKIENQALIISLYSQIQNNAKDLALKNSQLSKFQQNLNELKIAKDHYEMISDKLKNDLDSQTIDYFKKIEEIGQFKVKLFDMKFENEKLSTSVNQLEERNFKLIKQVDKKTQQLLTEKQNVIEKAKEGELKISYLVMEIDEKKEALMKEVEESHKKDSEKLNKLEQIIYLRKQNTYLDHEVKEKKIVIEKLNAEIQTHINSIASLKKNAEIQSYTTKVKKNDATSEITNLQKILTQHKRTIQQRKQYVHPMQIEDLRDHIARLNERIIAMDKKSKHVVDNYDQMEEEVNRCRKMMEINKLEVERVNKKNEFIMKEVADLKDEGSRLKLQKDEILEGKEKQIKIMMEQFKQTQYSLKSQIIKIQEKLKQTQGHCKDIEVQLDKLETKRIKSEAQKLDKSSTAAQTDNIPVEQFTQVFIKTPIETSREALQATIHPRRTLVKNNETQPRFEKSERQPLEKKKSLEKSLQSSKEQIDSKSIHSKEIAANYEESEPFQQYEDGRREDRLEKKIEGKEFKKALRLTYMRR